MGARVRLNRLLNDGEKLAPQQKIIYDKMAEYGVDKEIDRAELVKAIEDDGKMQTKQTVDRILGYYMPNFAKMGIAETIKSASAPKSTEDKPKNKTSPADAEAKPEKAVDENVAA